MASKFHKKYKAPNQIRITASNVKKKDRFIVAKIVFDHSIGNVLAPKK